MLPENVLQHIWQFGLFRTEALQTFSGLPVTVKSSGIRNNGQGPDFSAAKIQIGNTLWAGNVEIHQKTSDWYKHQHHTDKNYQNVILHVVYEHDTEWNENIELVELKSFIPQEYLENIHNLFHNGLTFCLPHWKDIDRFYINRQLTAAGIEKMQTKQHDILQLHQQVNANWDEAFYVYLARYFGMNVNNLPFELLAKNTPLKIIEKHADNPFQVEALLFGQSGLLQKYSHSLYAQKLQKEYAFLQTKYNLQPLSPEIWKFARMRPTAFPTVKLAQLISLLIRHSRLFQQIIKAPGIKPLQQLFHTNVSEYWQTHYTFGNESKPRDKKLSPATINLLIINVVIPFGITYADYIQEPEMKEKFIAFLESIPPEKNNILHAVASCFSFENALQTQGMLYWKKHYCDAKKCLDCIIGNKIIQH